MPKLTFSREIPALAVIQILLLLSGIIGGYYTVRNQHDATRIRLEMYISELEKLRTNLANDYVPDKVYQAERAAILIELAKLNANQKETTDAVNSLRLEMAKRGGSGGGSK